MKSWTQYFTPPEVSAKLVKAIGAGVRPRTAVDICAGGGNLLLAVSERWPTIRLVGNDRYRRKKPVRVDQWSCQDGRDYAIQLAAKGVAYDIVVANPPFGMDAQRRTPFRDDATMAILDDQRIEVGMTAAAALLVAKGGVLATVLPETLVFGETHARLRRWLSERFCCFSVERIPRGHFRNQDLGLVMLTARRSHSGRCAGTLDSSPVHQNVLAFSACRGTLSSADLKPRGGVHVVHCAAGGDGIFPTVRRTSVQIVSQREVGRLSRSDLLVSRVGRGAGRVSVFEGAAGTPFTDCVLRVRGSTPREHAILTTACRDGKLERNLRAHLRGLGAQYVTKKDLERAIHRSLR